MAEPTSTTGAAPLTEAEQKQLDALNAKKAAAVQAEAETSRLARVSELSATADFIKLIRTDKMAAALQAAIDSKPDIDTLQRLMRIKSTFDFDVQSLSDLIAQTNTPTVPLPPQTT